MIDLTAIDSTPNLKGSIKVTVIISTRNRACSLVQTLNSILANNYPDYNLIVLDQSDEKLPENVLKEFEADERFCYVYSPTRGLGAGHNAAIALAKTELLAVTDDDCIIPSNWLVELVKAFYVDERIGLVFGNVLPAKYDPQKGYIPVFERTNPTLLKSVSDNLSDGLGIGACFGIRRSAWEAAGGFDEMLGPGAPLGSLEDRDIALRLLLKGYYIYQTPGFSVLHYGFRKNTELRKLAYRDWFGFGSSFAKYLKCRDFAITHYILIQMWLGQAVRPFFKILVFERRLQGVTPLWSFWVGFLAGLFHGVEAGTRKFKVSGKARFIPKRRLLKK